MQDMVFKYFIRRKFVHRKDLDLYKEYYKTVCNRRILLYNSIEDEEPLETIDRAWNFLTALSFFKANVPRRVIREKFENFEEERGLAREIVGSEGL